VGAIADLEAGSFPAIDAELLRAKQLLVDENVPPEVAEQPNSVPGFSE